MKILALDQAAATGWAIYENKKLLDYGVKRFGGVREAQAINLRDWAIIQAQQLGADVVLIEDIQMQRNVTTFKTLAYLQAALCIGMREQGIQYKIVSPSTWRSKNGIKGRLRAEQKKNAIALVKQLHNIEISNDAAEAVLIGRSFYL